MRGKRGVSGEGGILMIYRLMLVGFIALVILGISSISYAHHVDVSKVEAQIMSVKIIDCLTNTGYVDIDSFLKRGRDRLLETCGYENFKDRFFVRAKIMDVNGENPEEIFQGDAGKLWVVKVFETGDFVNAEAIKQRPGYFKETYDTLVTKSGRTIEGKIEIEVLVNGE